MINDLTRKSRAKADKITSKITFIFLINTSNFMENILITHFKNVDIICMEIISYNYNTYSTAPEKKTFKFTKFRNSPELTYDDILFDSYSKKEREPVTLKGIFDNIKAMLAYAKHMFIASARYWWLIPAVAVISSVPFFLSKILNLMESKAPVVSFENTDSQLLDYLDSLMSDFALESQSVDENGTLISESGAALFNSKSFKDTVSFQTYVVKNGDTISGIAKKFGLSNISTLIAANNISNVRNIVVGQKLTIPSIDGMYYKVAAGDNIASLASKYGARVEDILDVNDLTSDKLLVGQNIYIPGARMDASSLKKAMGDVAKWICPITAKYVISSYFGPRKDPISGISSNHKGIDLACPKGTSVKAAMKGTVAAAGWSNLYGNYVILNHEDGYQTLYGHMSKISVKRGQVINQGSQVGLVGSTGYSTGNHLHFTVYKNGTPVDPLKLIKK